MHHCLAGYAAPAAAVKSAVPRGSRGWTYHAYFVLCEVRHRALWGFPVVFSLRWLACVIAAGAGLLASAHGPAGADTLKWALTQAYQNNPQLNSQRAAVRATDETVPQALSGYRPRVSLTATVGEQYLDTTDQDQPARRAMRHLHQTSGNIGVQTLRRHGHAERCSTAFGPRAGPGRPSNWCRPRARRCG